MTRPVYYDLHIHTALSPCADNDMTPNDIVGMALLNGLDLIAVTDHNSMANAPSVIKAAENQELIVLPGIEVSTAEEVHVICLFSSLDSALDFEAELSSFYSTLKNRIDIFGNQLIFDASDQNTGEVERMLIAPASITFDDLFLLTHKYNGAFIPAHVDRDSFSVLSNLGFLPPHLSIKTIEVSPGGLDRGFVTENTDLFKQNKMVVSSDAHHLWSISEKEHFMLLPEKSAIAAIDFLR